MTQHHYHDSILVMQPGPFSCGFAIAYGALCPDGIRRIARPSSDGVSDTFFSTPAYVYAKGHRVYGYITLETMDGSSVETPDDPTTIKFIPYEYRKHWREVMPRYTWDYLANQPIRDINQRESEYNEVGAARHVVLQGDTTRVLIYVGRFPSALVIHQRYRVGQWEDHYSYTVEKGVQ